MVRLITEPTVIKACGNKNKVIKEFIGHVNSQTEGISIAQMDSPQGWGEPGQKPEFDEYSVVIEGQLHVKTREGQHIIKAGQAIIAPKGEWVQYSTPKSGGAKYLAVCLPAFHPDKVHRDHE